MVAKNPFSVPCAPDAPDAVDITSDSMTVIWNESRFDGGSLISGYYVDMRPGSEGNWMRMNNEVIPADTYSYRLNGLMADKEYYFR